MNSNTKTNRPWRKTRCQQESNDHTIKSAPKRHGGKTPKQSSLRSGLLTMRNICIKIGLEASTTQQNMTMIINVSSLQKTHSFARDWAKHCCCSCWHGVIMERTYFTICWKVTRRDEIPCSAGKLLRLAHADRHQNLLYRDMPASKRGRRHPTCFPK